MTLRFTYRQSIVAMLCVLLVLVISACGSGAGDDDTGDATSTATTAPASAAGGSTPTEADDSVATERPDATEPANATSGSGAAGTATEADEDAPTATIRTQATGTATDAQDDEPTAAATTGSTGPTATEPAGSTETTGGNDIPEFETLDPELLPNFSMRMNFDAVNLSGTPQTTLAMQMEQSAIDNYHLNMDSDGELLEFWTIGEQSWTSLAGEVIESPTGPLFTPADILTTGELIPEGLEARVEGNEEVNGRDTTKWVVDGADYVAYMNEDDTATVEMSDGTGEVIIWIDDELNIILKASGDVAWSNGDGTNGSLVYDYEIFDIGSTADVQAPQ